MRTSNTAQRAITISFLKFFPKLHASCSIIGRGVLSTVLIVAAVVLPVVVSAEVDCEPEKNS